LSSPQKGDGPPAVFALKWSSAVEPQNEDAAFGTGGSGKSRKGTRYERTRIS